MAKKKPDLDAVDRHMEKRSKVNDGGSAFPRPASEFTLGGTLGDGDSAIPEQDGMSLRDFFAGQAFSIFAHPTWPKSSDAALIAETAYAIADAMIAERAK